MRPSYALLLLAIAASPHTRASSQVISVEEAPVFGQPLSGADYLLIAEAARHRALRGVNISCYQIYVYRYRGVPWVSFLEARQRVIESDTTITRLPPDPHCRSISFEMNAGGRVERVVRSRD